MAEAIISFVIEHALSEVISIIGEKVKLQLGFQDDLKDLSFSLAITTAFLQDAERNELDQDRCVQIWLNRLKEIVPEANDLLDELHYEVVRKKVETQMRKKVRNFFSISKNPIVFNFKRPRAVQYFNINLKKINDVATQFGLHHRVLSLPQLSTGDRITHLFADPYRVGGITHSLVESSQVVGRKTDVSNVIDLLIGSNTQQTFSVVSIVGTGGLGKTTLAKLVCQHMRVKNHFKKIVWVCVSDKFDVDKILEEMFVSITGEAREGKTRDEILKKIEEKLEGKPYLLTLDDVWEENSRTWENLRGSLLGINKKTSQSRIFVTSRSENVAVVRETPKKNRYLLGKMGDDECWDIIKSRAFQNSQIQKELEDIGRDIASKCRGVPLLANVIGGTMCNKRDIKDWVALKDSSEWDSFQNNEGVVSVLKSSYDQDSFQNNERVVSVLKSSYDLLPFPSLKQCFAYCSIFPKDYMIQKDELIQLWMAEGFIQNANEGRNSEQTLEDIGNEYFNYLLSNSFFQEVEKNELGCIIGCKMQNRVHDFAESLSKPKMVSDIYVNVWHSLFTHNSKFCMEADFKCLRVLKFAILICHTCQSQLVG